jgi:hypothetical protein
MQLFIYPNSTTPVCEEYTKSKRQCLQKRREKREEEGWAYGIVKENKWGDSKERMGGCIVGGRNGQV